MLSGFLSVFFYFVIGFHRFGLTLNVGGSKMGTKSGRLCRKLELSWGTEQPIFYELNPATDGRFYLPFSINSDKVGATIKPLNKKTKKISKSFEAG